MTINGGIKFFDTNIADSKTGSVATASTGLSSAPFILDRNKFTVWRSSNSNDTITESIEIQLQVIKSFDRLFLIGHNFKSYTVEYWDGFAWSDFQNVLSINGVSSTTISKTGYTLGSSYHEFAPVLTSAVRITCTETQTTNDEKFLNKFVICSELGTLDGFPIIQNSTKDRNIRKPVLLNGRRFVSKSLEIMRFTVNFKNYPAVLVDDIDLLYSLFARDESFFVWLCGGRNGNPYFKYQLTGFRIEDLIQMQVTNVFKDSYRKNFYNGVVNLRMLLEEAF